MKYFWILLCLLFAFAFNNGYDKVYYFGEYKTDWARIKKDGKQGFITIKGNEILNN